LQAHARQQLRVAFEEIGMVLQVLRDRLLLGRVRWNAAHLVARNPVLLP